MRSRARASPRAVRELFRALHTIKGLSAMVDVEPIVSIAHWMETALRHADHAGGRLPEASIEPLLEGLRAIEQRVRQLAAGKPVSAVPAGLLDRLEALEAAEQGAPRGAARSGTAGAGARDRREALRRRSRSSCWRASPRASGRCALDFVPSRGARAARASPSTPCASAWASSARSSRCCPVAGATSGGGNLTFALLLLTGEDDAVLLEAAGGPPATLRPLGSPASAAPPPPCPEALLQEERDEEVRRGAAPGRCAARGGVPPGRGAGAAGRARRHPLEAGARGGGAHRGRCAHARARPGAPGERAPAAGPARRHPPPAHGARGATCWSGCRCWCAACAAATGKQVRLEMDVGDAELDKAVADRLLPALVHLVRNAVDHAPRAAPRSAAPPASPRRACCAWPATRAPAGGSS